MSEEKKTIVKTKFSLGLSGLAGVVGTIAAFLKTPLFIGGVGLGMAALTGAGTFLGATLGGFALGFAGIAAGAVIGGLIGLPFRKFGVLALLGSIGGGVVGSVGGNVMGAVKGYEMSRDALIRKTCEAPFNQAAEKACQIEVKKPAPTLFSVPKFN